MKFNDIAEKDWQELQPYLDTCLLPVTGLNGMESPWQATKALEELRHALDELEIPYRGRTVTYPAVQYIHEETKQFETWLSALCDRLKQQAGFQYVVIVTASPQVGNLQVQSADLIFARKESQKQAGKPLQQLWANQTNE